MCLRSYTYNSQGRSAKRGISRINTKGNRELADETSLLHSVLREQRTGVLQDNTVAFPLVHLYVWLRSLVPHFHLLTRRGNMRRHHCAVLLLLCATLFLAACNNNEVPPPGCYDWPTAKDHIGSVTCLCGPIRDAYYAKASAGRPTFINIGWKKAPDQGQLTILIWGEHRDAFSTPPDLAFRSGRVCARGPIHLHRGDPQLEVEIPSQIWRP